jgi:translation initiation factor IF-2
VEAPRRGRAVNEEEEEATVKKGGAKVPAKVPAARKGEDTRRRGRLTVTKALSGDDERTRSVAAYKRHLQRINKGTHSSPPVPPVRAR